jgi:hypothetical protein
MKKLLFSLSLSAVSFFCGAQSWAEYMSRPDANLYKAQQLFYSYWQGKDVTEKGKGYKAFKRWENFMTPRVYPSGDIALVNQSGKNFQDWLAAYTPPNGGGGGLAGKFNNVNMIASATWTAMGPFGPLFGNAGGQLLKAGRICFITVNPTNTLNLYIGTPAGGLWRSNDGGTSWTTNTDNFTNCGFSDLCIVPTNTNVMYAATGDGDAGDTPSYGVLKSTDGGNTWAATGLTFPVTSNYLIRRLVVNPTNSLVLMAATNGGLYRTTDGGATWSSVVAGQHYDIEFQPGNPNTVYAAGTTVFRKSTNGGATWTTISNGIPTTGQSRLAIAVTPANPNMVYVIAGNNTNYGLTGVYKSTDAATTFTNLNVTQNLLGWASAGNDTGGQSWYDLAIAADPNNANIVVTGGVNVWRTTDGGSTWSLYGHWTGSGAPFTHADHHDLVYDANSGLYDTNDGTVYKRNGAVWQEISGTMNISEIYKVGTSALTANRWITGHQDNGTSLWTGTTYSAQLGGDGMDCFIDRTNNNNMFGEYYQGQYMRTTNGGVSWSSYQTGISGTAAWVAPWKQDPQTSTVIYGGYTNLFKSILSTGTWTALAALPNTGQTITEFAIAPTNSLIIYVLKNGGIYKTINGGTSWTTITGTVPVGSGAPTFITICPTDPNKAWVTLSGYSSGNKVFQTTDGGTTWTNYSANLPNLPANCSVYQSGTNDRIYVGMDVGVYYRDNTQASWTLYNTGLPNIPVFDMEISPADPTKIVAATYGRGAWVVSVIANATPVSAFSYSGNPCTNSPIVFNDVSVNGPTSWTWSASPAVGVTINTPSSQNPTITFANAGTYTVTLNTSNGNGPGTPASQTINIIATPTVIVTNSVNNICSGNTVNITASGATTYSWSNGATTSVIAVSPAASTVYTVTGNNGVCSNAKTASVNVTTSPTVSANNGTVCSGNPAVLTASGATTYSWSNGATTASISVTPSATAVYTVIGSNGSCTNAITSTVSVNTTPTVIVTGSVQSICSGSTVNITASGATTYSWSNGATTSVIAVSPTANIVYTVTGYNGACTNVKTASINMTASPTVAVNNGTICNGGAITLTATGATTYSWSNGSTTSTVSVSPSVTTVYTVTGSNGTCTNVKTVTVNVGATPTVVITNSVNNICSGSTVNITASGATTYSWSNGATTSVMAVSPTANVVYTVTGYNGACTNVKTATVNVTASPTVNVNSASICSGTNVILTASGATSYSWSNGPVTNTVSVSPLVTTVYTVTGSNGTCSNVKTATVTVTPSPTIIIANNSQTICSGSSVNINASGAASYFWNNGATTSVITVSPLSTTVYTVTGMNGSCQDIKTATVVVNAIPSLTVNNGTICAGNNVLLTASGANTYSWSNGATTNTINVSPAVTTVYSVTGNSNGCMSTMMTTVIVNPLPSINASASETSICRGDAVTLSATGANTYTWQPGNLGGSPVNDNPFVTTTYTVNGTDINGCIGTQTLMIQVNICTGMMENGSEAVMFSVFPNPTSDYVSLFYPSNSNVDLKVQVIDALGRLISERSHTFSKNSPSLQINVSEVAKGTYFLKLIPKSGEAKAIKLIKD